MMNYEKCFCASCGQRIEYPAEGTGQTVQCPTCGKPTILLPSNPPAAANPSASPVDSPALPLKQKMARIPLSQLTEVTIRGRTKSGDTPLHRAAKTGKFDEIPKHLLQLELFMAKNCREETPLHFAAKHGHLNQIPSEFLTTETLTALDYYGRTPLHVAADYRHADQIPKEFLTSEMLSLPTKNFTSNTILHFAAATNTLALIPSNYITPGLLQIRNGYGLTPLETLKEHLPTQKQLAHLRELGVAFEEANLTKERASGLIDTKHEEAEHARKRTNETRLGLIYVKVKPSDSAIEVGPTARITLLAKSSSGNSSYRVDFVTDGPSVRVYCHCQAGVQQWMCKHKLAFILGDSNMLFDPGQIELLSQIQSWPQYSDLKTRTEEFQSKLIEIEEASVVEDSKFYTWLETRNKDKQTNTDEETSFIEVYMGFGDDDPEAQQKLEAMNEAKGELKRMQKSVKADFMVGLTMGFHRDGKSAV